MNAETRVTDEARFAGGVSCELALIEGPEGPCVVKQARARLNVRADWPIGAPIRVAP
jgi:hypothetical protein